MAADDEMSGASALTDGAAMSAAERALNDAVNKQSGGDDPAAGVGATEASDRLPDRRPPPQ
jgi:hypothetical protein